MGKISDNNKLEVIIDKNLVKMFNFGVESGAKIVDKFTNPIVLAEKLTWLESPMTFARVMEQIAKAIRELKE